LVGDAVNQVFVNLKRFDVSRELGGVCPIDNQKQWIEWVLEKSVRNGLGKLENIEVTFLLPEALIIAAIEKLSGYPEDEIKSIKIGCQGVFREDVTKGGNFGTFTTNRPAAVAKSLGCTCTIIGHSEERKDKLGIIARYDPSTLDNEDSRKKAKQAVDAIINEEVHCALNNRIKVLICVGETAEEKGNGSFEEQKPRIEAVLKSQLETGLKGVEAKQPHMNIVIGYEPIWAIGPGKVPPGAEYISYVSSYIKRVVVQMYSFEPIVVYGGGLKEENAEMLASVETIDGGLVALTRFTGDIGFYPDELKRIIDKYT